MAVAPVPPPAEGDLWIEVSVGEQAVCVYRGNELVRVMKASTGRPETPTPLGSFRVVGRGEWFYNPKYRAGGFWWVSFVPSGEYLFHSIPADARRHLIPEAARLLGQPASRGCVRLSPERGGCPLALRQRARWHPRRHPRRHRRLRRPRRHLTQVPRAG